MREKISEALLKGFWVLVAVGVLFSYIDKNTRWLKPDYSQPHEYLKVVGYGANGESMEDNDHSYSGNILTDYKDNFFSIGNGQCIEYLSGISDERVKLSMEGFNYFLNTEGDYNDIRVAHAEMQCIRFSGMDEDCEAKFRNLAKSVKETRIALAIIIESTGRCRREEKIGESRTITLEASRRAE